MNFIENIEKEKYEKFVKNHPKSHFLQSYAWGEFAKEEKNLTPHYVGLENDKHQLVAATLLLEKHLPLGYCYLYAPRGYVIDFKDFELLKTFTEEIKKYAKKRKAIFVKIDPDIIYHEEDCNQKIIIDKDDQAYQSLKKLGYRHLGFTKNFETMQPRYTFRIDFTKPWEEVEKNFSKTTKQRIKKAEDLLVDVEIGTEKDIQTFYQLMILTETRKDFVTHNEKYYQSLYKIWNQDNECNLFLGSVDLDKIIKKQTELKQEILKELTKYEHENLSKSEKSKKNELEKRKDKLETDIIKYQQAQKEYGTNITLSAHFIIEYGDKAWVLYAGNHNILTDTYTNYKTYEQHIKYYYDKKIKTYDQFGTIGDLRKENPLLGLHEFKKKFGGNYIEFTGEFDLVLNKPMYFIFTKLVPLYRKLIKNIAKKKRGK
ncbi:MAG TPA: peptidoglycan bridge formation glycyltransferase FemA/FemB family protein [Candidatus Scybalousia intestinigallinarum]|nr:peptidoglycan bridge formation glycyltransferase FemA/FemB family protein [Candidatus Scybalousia intestinigallinarum]